MAPEWRPRCDPPYIPLEVVAHEDFVREVSFAGATSSLPVGSTISLVIYPDEEVDSPAIATWPAVVDPADVTGSWSVDHVTADAVDLPAFYRLWLSVPNADDIANPTIERCLALGPMTRK